MQFLQIIRNKFNETTEPCFSNHKMLTKRIETSFKQVSEVGQLNRKRPNEMDET